MSDLPDRSEPENSTPDLPTDLPTDGDHGAALERSAESIRDARDAEGTVAAHDDITARDDERAGEHSEDLDGTGGHP
jgi:hypothetical protein